MPHYKDTGNQLHFLDDTAFEYMLPEGSVQISDEEADAIRAEQQAATPAPEPVEPVTKLKDFLTANPDVAALLGA